MATRLLDQNPVYFNNDNTVCAGGELRFYESETTTPLNVYSSPTLGTSLGSTVTLDASGRAEDDIWLAVDAYRVRLYTGAAPDGVMVWSRDFAGDTATGAVVVPDPSTGDEDDVLSTDGVAYLFRAIREVPDPTGNSGKYVGTDGTAVSWTAFPAAVTYDEDTLPGGFTQGATSVQIGKFKIQTGTGSAPTAAAESTTSAAVTFGEAYATLLHIDVTPTGTGGFTGRGAGVDKQVNGSTTGFTVRFYAGAEHGSNDYNITSTVNFTWVAFGIVA